MQNEKSRKQKISGVFEQNHKCETLAFEHAQIKGGGSYFSKLFD